MNDYLTNSCKFNYRKLREEGFVVYKTDSVNLIFTLRGGYMVDVFDLDSSAHVAYIDFDIKRNVMLGNSFGSPLIGLPFSNQFRKVFEKHIFPFRDLRLRHSVGLFVERTYRNKGQKRLWNLDKILMAIALETAFEEGIKTFTIKPTGDRTRYYRSNFNAEIYPTSESEVILGIKLRFARKKMKHIEFHEIKGLSHFFTVEGRIPP